MPNLSLKIPNTLTQPLTLTRIKTFLPELATQNSDRISNQTESWSGSIGTFKFKISGFKVSGVVIVGDDNVLITGDLPFLASPFREQIESTIQQKAEAVLK